MLTVAPRYNARMSDPGMESAPPELPETAQAPESPQAPDQADALAAPVAKTKARRDAAAIDHAELALQIEAALLSNDRAMPATKLAELLDVPASKIISDRIAELNEQYEKTGRSFRIEQVAGGYQILTLPRFREVLATLHKSRAESKLSPSAMETLAIIAYKQPILRADVESIRGVASGEVIRSLLDRQLVKIVGRAEELGRPMLYGTTKRFLEVFGLASLKDLPKVEELREKAK